MERNLTKKENVAAFKKYALNRDELKKVKGGEWIWVDGKLVWVDKKTFF
ncbi:MAG: hypothetical protein LBE56_13940 [Tannerella sp.]|jgi:hypothetical protein|nr:hypothetical protein [Tannerella sp.]